VMRIGGSFRSGRPPVKRHPDPSSFVWVRRRVSMPVDQYAGLQPVPL
jgi:hypothetical protein